MNHLNTSQALAPQDGRETPSDILLKTGGHGAGMRLPPKPHGQPLRLDFTQEDANADLVLGAIEGDP